MAKRQARLIQVITEITQDDIDHDVMADCIHCPGARAINRHLAEGYYASVTNMVIHYYRRKKNPNDLGLDHHIDTTQAPKSLREFIYSFDSTGKGEPITFQHGIPRECLRPDHPALETANV